MVVFLCDPVIDWKSVEGVVPHLLPPLPRDD